MGVDLLEGGTRLSLSGLGSDVHNEEERGEEREGGIWVVFVYSFVRFCSNSFLVSGWLLFWFVSFLFFPSRAFVFCSLQGSKEGCSFRFVLPLLLLFSFLLFIELPIVRFSILDGTRKQAL